MNKKNVNIEKIIHVKKKKENMKLNTMRNMINHTTVTQTVYIDYS